MPSISGVSAWHAGTVGIFSLIPGLTDLTGAFGMSQMVCFVWLGSVLLRGNPGSAEQPSSSLLTTTP